jgi:hypothetical protein
MLLHAALGNQAFCVLSENSEAILGLKLGNHFWLSFLYTFVLDPNDHVLISNKEPWFNKGWPWLIHSSRAYHQLTSRNPSNSIRYLNSSPE